MRGRWGLVAQLRAGGGRPRPRGGAAKVTAPRPFRALSSRWAADRGSATVWTVGAIGVLCVVFGVVLGLGQAVVVRHRAAGGADMAALAAADHWAEGTAAACAKADRVARAQGARLTRCVLVGDVSDVSAASGAGPFAAEVRARAGPGCNARAGSGRDAPRRGARLGHLRLRRVGATGPQAPVLTQAPVPATPAPPAAAP